MNILIYSPSGHRAVDQQSQAELLMSLGHTVFLLTWTAPGALHHNFEQLGAKAFSAESVKGRSVFFFIRQARFLVKFCREHSIDVIFSNLQPNAIAAGLAKYFIKAKTIYIRHNADYFHLKSSIKDKWLNRLANFLSPRIMAISGNVRTALLKEGVPDSKIIRINLCYNFDQYATERKFNMQQIRSRMKNDFVILYMARLDSLKGHTEAFEAIRQLRDQGKPCTLLCIGEGPYRPVLEKWIAEHNMQDYIVLEGFITNAFDYIEAADIMLLLSRSEASNNAVKEAGMCKRTAIVCRGVGDFEEYLVHGENGFLVSKEDPIPGTVEVISALHDDAVALHRAGEKLFHTITTTFGMDPVRPLYEKLLSEGGVQK